MQDKKLISFDVTLDQVGSQQARVVLYKCVEFFQMHANNAAVFLLSILVYISQSRIPVSRLAVSNAQENLLILCGHYKGVDQRIRDLWITKEISIGDYVLSGGELGAAVLCDAIIRLIPGVLNDETSALTDTFQDNLLAPPVYTRPRVFKGLEVPEVLTSGHAGKIEAWREAQAQVRTRERRPDLLNEE